MQRLAIVYTKLDELSVSEAAARGHLGVQRESERPSRAQDALAAPAAADVKTDELISMLARGGAAADVNALRRRYGARSAGVDSPRPC